VGGRLVRTKAGRGNTTAWIDLGGQWVGDTQTHLLALAKKLGIKVNTAGGFHVHLEAN
jgi:monoamine oxidase